MNGNASILALDVGDARVGVALANTIARIPAPLAIVENDEKVFDAIKDLVEKNNAQTIVVGLPRNMQGEETAQSKASRDFAEKLKQQLDLPITFADESLSTKRAENYMRKRPQGHLDDIAACFILEEYLGANK